ncbi:MAG: hypothetical protein JSW11_00115 [Candidatus Heimdallarchaeota archaeon]|nr:MAG: hypothetical protein JSW11_00115 [Candidatus Heimdallarchaeota archaeon]
MMSYEDSSSEEEKRQQELKELKKYLKLANGSSEHALIATWHCIKHMQSALNLPPHTPIEDLVNLFDSLEEIRKAFNFHIENFTQLNEIYWEITTIKKRLNFPEDSSITDILSRIKPNVIPALGLDENSLLKRLLQLYLPRLNQSI